MTSTSHDHFLRRGDDEPSIDEDRAWNGVLFTAYPGSALRPEGVAACHWPDGESIQWAETLLCSLIDLFAPDGDDALKMAARGTAMSRAAQIRPQEQKAGRLARIGLPMLAGQVILEATAALLDAQDYGGIADDLRELNRQVWYPERSQANFGSRMALVRQITPYAPDPSIPVDLDRICSFAVCADTHFQPSLRSLMRDTVHHDRLFQPPAFAVLRQALITLTRDFSPRTRARGRTAPTGSEQDRP
ncbi:hypothetical protein AB0A73_21540 [Glycomyces sp. NPDC047369]